MIFLAVHSARKCFVLTGPDTQMFLNRKNQGQKLFIKHPLYSFIIEQLQQTTLFVACVSDVGLYDFIKIGGTPISKPVNTYINVVAYVLSLLIRLFVFATVSGY